MPFWKNTSKEPSERVADGETPQEATKSYEEFSEEYKTYAAERLVSSAGGDSADDSEVSEVLDVIDFATDTGKIPKNPKQASRNAMSAYELTQYLDGNQNT